jgi:hypothetical protein
MSTYSERKEIMNAPEKIILAELAPQEVSLDVLREKYAKGD